MRACSLVDALALCPVGVTYASALVLRYVLDKGVLVERHGDKDGLNAVSVYDSTDGMLIFTRPWLLCFDTDGLGRDLSRLRGAIGDKRLDDGMVKA